MSARIPTPPSVAPTTATASPRPSPRVESPAPAPAAPPVTRPMLHPNYARIAERIRAAGSVIDLGCGLRPVEGATAAMDAFLDDRQRGLGWNGGINPEQYAAEGIRFVHGRIDEPLPFADNEFDFAYSSHVFEHLEDPATACREMARIAKAGVIITPAVFTELAFGRPYHKWLVMDGDNELFFFPKTEEEYGPFGEPLGSSTGGGYEMTEETTPFDPLLNDGEWYQGGEDLSFGAGGVLRDRLRWHYQSRSPVMEVMFHWDDDFRVTVIPRRQSERTHCAPWTPGRPHTPPPTGQ